MSEPVAVRFGDMAWEDDVAGIRDRASTVDSSRWAMVEYAADAARAEWCEDGHRGLVLDGEIEYEFGDGRDKLLLRSRRRVPAAVRRGAPGTQPRRRADHDVPDRRPGGRMTAPGHDSPIAALREASDSGGPKVTFRHAGDQFLLVEYGEMVFDLELNFFVLTVDGLLARPRARRPRRHAPGLPLDPDQLRPGRPRARAADRRAERHPGRGAGEHGAHASRAASSTCRSRSTTRSSREAVERYARTIRERRPERRGRHEHRLHRPLQRPRRTARSSTTTVLATEQWTAFIGFFPGLPFMFPLDPRRRALRAEVQPDAHVDGRGRGRASAAPASRSTRSSRPAATSCSAARCRSTTSRGGNAAFRREPAAPARRATASSSTASTRTSSLQAFAGRPRRPLPLPDRGRPLRRRRIPRLAADDDRGGGGATAAPRARPRPRHRCHEVALEILDGGIQTTVQDYPGRRGMLAQGFFPAGPMDHFALPRGQPPGRQSRVGGGASRSRSAASRALRRGRDGRALRRRCAGDRRRRGRCRCGRAMRVAGGRRARDRHVQGPGFRVLSRASTAASTCRCSSARARRYTHGRARRARGPAAPAGRPAAARRARRGTARRPPRSRGGPPAVRARLGGRAHARPAGGARLPDRGRHGAAVGRAAGRSTELQPHRAAPRVAPASSGRARAAASRAATRRTSSTTAIPPAASTSTATCP